LGFGYNRGYSFHHYHPHHSLKTPLETTNGEIGRRIKEKQGFEDESRHGLEQKLSFPSLFFSILSLVSFNLEMYSLLIPSKCEQIFQF